MLIRSSTTLLTANGRLKICPCIISAVLILPLTESKKTRSRNSIVERLVLTDIQNGNNVGERIDISPGIFGTLIASRNGILEWIFCRDFD